MFFVLGQIEKCVFCCTGSFALKVKKNTHYFLIKNMIYNLKIASESLISTIFFWMRGYSRCCKIASNLLFINGRKFYHFISVSVLLYIPTLLLSLPCLPPTHPTTCYLVCIFVRYSFKSNITVKISFLYACFW